MVEAANTLNTLLSILKVLIMKEVSQSDANLLFLQKLNTELVYYVSIKYSNEELLSESRQSTVEYQCNP